MQITVAAKRRKGEWRAAHIVEGAFEDAFVGSSLSDLLVDAVGGILAAAYPEGTEVVVNIAIVLPKPKETANGSSASAE